MGSVKGHIKPARGQGKIIRDVRTKLGLTQTAFAGELGVSFSTVSNWERGQVEIPAARFAQIRMLLSEREGRLVKPLV